MAGTYHRVDPSPVGPFGALVSLPQGFVEAGEVVAAILFVGGAWVVVDGLGTLGRLVGAIASAFRRRNRLAIPVVSFFFASMGALENMQEEIIPLVPVLLLLGRRLGVDAVVVVAMSAGAAMIGSAFGPANPFQAGIAMQLAELAPLSGGGVRVISLAAAFVVWVIWTLRYAETRRRRRPRPPARRDDRRPAIDAGRRDLPDDARADGGLRLRRDRARLGFQRAVCRLRRGRHRRRPSRRPRPRRHAGRVPRGHADPAARGGDGRRRPQHLRRAGRRPRHRHDPLRPQRAAQPWCSATTAALLMIPFHAIVHIPVSSVSGHAVLTMPVLVPLSDLLGISRQVTVMAYQTGAGLTELLTPTNGALMAILLAAGVSFERWFRFALVGVAARAADRHSRR